MRIATASQFQRSVDIIQQRQQALQSTQEQLISGKRIARASDDPTEAARAERAMARQARVEATQRALEVSRSVSLQAESAMGDAVDVMQRVRELVVQAGNAVYDDTQRLSLGEEIRSLRQQLLGIANRSDGAGGFLFAGQGASMPPFVDGASGIEFKGTAGAMLAAADELLPLSVDGQATWLQSPTGNGVFETSFSGTNTAPELWIDVGQVTDPGALTGDGYTLAFVAAGTEFDVQITRNSTPPVTTTQPYVSGQAIEFDGLAVTVTGTPVPGDDEFILAPSERTLSPFDVLDELATQLVSPGRTSAQQTQTVQFGLRDIDATLGTLVAVRSRLGGVLERTESISGRLDSQKLAAQTERSEAEDLDMVEAVSEFQNRQTSYDAALKAYSMVQRLSLFEYIG